MVLQIQGTTHTYKYSPGLLLWGIYDTLHKIPLDRKRLTYLWYYPEGNLNYLIFYPDGPNTRLPDYNWWKANEAPHLYKLRNKSNTLTHEREFSTICIVSNMICFATVWVIISQEAISSQYNITYTSGRDFILHFLFCFLRVFPLGTS